MQRSPPQPCSDSPSYKSEGRTESQFLSCLRVGIEGKRLVWAVAFSDALSTYKHYHSDSSKTPSTGDIVDFIFNADMATMQWMSQQQKFIYHRVLVANTALYIPPGFIIFERCTNEGFCGVKISGYIDEKVCWSEIEAIRQCGGRDLQVDPQQ